MILIKHMCIHKNCKISIPPIKAVINPGNYINPFTLRKRPVPFTKERKAMMCTRI